MTSASRDAAPLVASPRDLVAFVDLAACANARAWLDAKKKIGPATATDEVLEQLRIVVDEGRYPDEGDRAIVTRLWALGLIGPVAYVLADATVLSECSPRGALTTPSRLELDVQRLHARLTTCARESSMRLKHAQLINAGFIIVATAVVGCSGAGSDATERPGEVGAKGPVGATGETGAPGTTGAAGAAGSDGTPGATGDAGADGTPGATGDVGAPGTPGATGDAGATGAPGAPGDVGATGEAGANASCYGITAPVISSVTVASGPYFTGVGYAVTVALSSNGGSSQLAYGYIGNDATFSNTSATPSLTPAHVGGPFNYEVIVSNGCQTAISSFSLDVVHATKAIWPAVHVGSILDWNTLAKVDAWCMSDPGLPAGVTSAKAMTAGLGGRTACTSGGAACTASQNVDWVLGPNTAYANSGGALIGVTNSAGIFSFPLSNGMSPAKSITAWTYTGLNTDWTSSTDNCSSWTSTTGTISSGMYSDLGVNAIHTASIACNATAETIYCVEQ